MQNQVAYDEMYAADGQVRPHYGVLGLAHPRARGRAAPEACRGRRLFHRVGITFAVYGEQDGNERLIPFDIVPRILSAGEWQLAGGGAAPAHAGAERVRRRHLSRPGHPARRHPVARADLLQPAVPPRNAGRRRTGRHLLAHRRHRHRARRRRASSTCSRTTCACRPASRTCSKTAR